MQSPAGWSAFPLIKTDLRTYESMRIKKPQSFESFDASFLLRNPSALKPIKLISQVIGGQEVSFHAVFLK
jgi:hypothetical protein